MCTSYVLPGLRPNFLLEYLLCPVLDFLVNIYLCTLPTIFPALPAERTLHKGTELSYRGHYWSSCCFPSRVRVPLNPCRVYMVYLSFFLSILGNLSLSMFLIGCFFRASTLYPGALVYMSSRRCTLDTPAMTIVGLPFPLPK